MDKRMSLYTTEDLEWDRKQRVFATNGDYEKAPKGWSKKEWEEYLNYCKKEGCQAVPSGYYRPDGEREEYLWCPTNISNYEKAQFVVANGPAIIDGMLCDVFSASTMVQVFSGLSEKNRIKLNDCGFAGAHTLCFRVVNRRRNKQR